MHATIETQLKNKGFKSTDTHQQPGYVPTSTMLRWAALAEAPRLCELIYIDGASGDQIDRVRRTYNVTRLIDYHRARGYDVFRDDVPGTNVTFLRCIWNNVPVGVVSS